MKIAWSLAAITDREAIFDHIALDSLSAAVRIDDLIETQVEQLADFPESGRKGRIDGTRELVIQRTPYVAAYRVQADIAKILRILHGAQRWPRTSR